MADSAAHPPAGPRRLAEQIYVTHCLKEDSVLNQAGFSVRASSTADPALLKFALDYPMYELPVDMWGRSPQPYQSPRRLALVPAPGGRVALVHSSYLTRDTINREGSFLTHLLIYEALTLREAVESWGAAEWRTEAYEDGAPRRLNPMAGVPRGGLIDDSHLTEFLTRAEPSAPQSLATAVFPDRAQGDPARRRRWLRHALQGAHEALRPPPAPVPLGAPQRDRFYLLAEPGLVALLLYGVARLLPDRLVSGLTFSTYEPGQTSLRDFKLAQVIGTYNETPLRALEKDYLYRRGVGLDAVNDRTSEELQHDPDGLFEPLVELAAAGAWGAVEEVRALWAGDERLQTGAWMPAAVLADAPAVQPRLKLLEAGRITAGDLIALQKSRLGRELLDTERYRGLAWTGLRDHWSESDVRQEFPDLLREHLAELVTETREKIASGAPEEWRERWGAIRTLIPPDRQADQLAGMLGSLKADALRLPFETREALLREWLAVAPQGGDVPPEHHWLLATRDNHEFQRLARAALPERAVALAACLALHRQGGDELVRNAPDELLRNVFAVLDTLPERAALFARLFPPGTKSADLLGQVLRLGIRPDPALLDQRLIEAGADREEWDSFWSEGDHLADSLVLLRADSRFSRSLWDRYGRQIDWRAVPGPESRPRLRELLTRARAKAGDQAPEGWSARLDAAALIDAQLKAPPAATPAALQDACKRLGIDNPLPTFKEYLRTRPEAQKESFEWLKSWARSLHGFYPEDEPALRAWLELAAAVLDRSHAVTAQLAFFEGAVPAEHRHRLAERCRDVIDEKVFRAMTHYEAVEPLAAPRPSARRWPGLRPSKSRMSKAVPLLLGLAVVGGVALAGLRGRWGRLRPAQAEARLNPGPSALNRAEGPAAASGVMLDGGRADVEALRAEKVKAEQKLAAANRKVAELLAENQKLRAAAGTRPGAGAAPEKALQAAEAEKGAAIRVLRSCLDYLVEDSVRENRAELARRQVDQALSLSVDDPSFARRLRHLSVLLSNLAYHDLPMQAKDPGQKAREDVKDMALVRLLGRTMVAVLSKNDRVSIFDLIDGKLAEGEARWREPFAPINNVKALAATPKGEFFLLVRQGRTVEPLQAGVYHDGETIPRPVDEKVQPRFERSTFAQANLTHPGAALPTDGKLKVAISPAHLIAVAAAPQHDKIFSYSYDSGRFSLADQDLQLGRTSEPAPVAGIAVHPEGTWAAVFLSGSGGQTYLGRVYRILAGTKIYRRSIYPGMTATISDPGMIVGPHQEAILGAAFSLDGRWLATWSQDKVVALWELPDSQDGDLHADPLDLGTPSQPFRVLAFSPRGRFLALGNDDGDVLIWATDAKQEVLRLRHAGPVKSLAFSPEGRFLAALTERGRVRVWTTAGWEGAPHGGRDPGPAGE